MRCIDELRAGELKGKRVLLRSDFNLPLGSDGEVSDVYRLKQGWKSVKYLAEQGARVIILTHIGRDPKETTAPVARAIKNFATATYVPDLTGAAAQGAVATMRDGETILLENVRSDPRENENDESFAKELASLADLYVDDAFAVSHRAHASLVGITKFLPSYAGLLMRNEVYELNQARTPSHPSFAILGGAKFETKAPLIKLLLEKYDHVFIVGALANDVFKARGLTIGVSLISKELPETEVLNHPHFVAPIDVTVEKPDGQAMVKKPEDVKADERIVDIGPDSVASVAPHVAKAKFILWSGPTGMYEKGYISWTHAVAELLAKSEAQKVIGGGDTIAAIERSGVPQDKLGFLSTGGGAMLEYLLKGTLPAIEALG